MEVVTLPTRNDSRVDRIRNLEPDWDSYGAVPITEAALATADAIERNLTFVPVADGGFQLELHSGGINVELCFDPNGEFEGVYVERTAAAVRPEPDSIPRNCGCGPNTIQVECPYHGGAI